MARVLKLSRSRSELLAATVVYLEARRRKRVANQPTSPAAPVITDGWSEWDVTQVGWVDLVFNISFVHGSFAVAQMEVWERHTGQSTHLLATIASTATQYRQTAVSQGSGTYYYKVRYKNGALFGPFSNEFRIDFTPV